MTIPILIHLMTLRAQMAELDQVRSGRLSSLTIDGFRGFRDTATLDFDASAVLISGPNGTGKTSIFDAIQWLLVGDVARLSSHKLRRNEEYLANVYKGTAPATVEGHFRLAGGTLRARRTGNSNGSNLEVEMGGETRGDAEAAQLLQNSLVNDDLTLSEVLSTNGLLQQDDLRQLLRTKPEMRYRQLLRLLGLEVLEMFDRYASTRRDTSRKTTRSVRDTLERLRAEAETMRERLETARLQVQLQGSQGVDTSNLTTVLRSLEDLFESTATPETAEQLAALGASLRSSRTQLQRVYGQLSSLPEELMPDPAAALSVVSTQLFDAQLAVERERQRQSDAQRALRSAISVQDAVSRLAAAAIPLLPVDQDTSPCPVCQTEISPRQVAAELEVRASTASAQIAAQALVDGSDEAVRSAERSLQELQMQEGLLRSQGTERQRSIEAVRQALGALDNWRTSLPSSFVTVAPAIVSTINSGTVPLDVAGQDAEISGVSTFESWMQVRTEVLATLGTLMNGLDAVADAADTAAAAATASKLATDRSAALPRQQALYDELESRLQQEERLYDEARRAETAATALAQSATAASTEIFRERFAALEPLINDIYARLDPHPAFTRLDIRVETYRLRGTATPNVVDVDEDIDANPMIVFSSAQANIVVLAAFLAIGWAAGDRGLPFVLLDDPLQALDDVNVLGFADLARRFRRQRQLVLATHEERFADLLQRKLTGRAEGEDLIVHRFVGWNRSGPLIETQQISPRPDLQFRVLAS